MLVGSVLLYLFYFYFFFTFAEEWLCVITANPYKDTGISIICTLSVIINC